MVHRDDLGAEGARARSFRGENGLEEQDGV